MAAAKKPKRKRGYKDDREYKQMEIAILKAEERVEALEAEAEANTQHARAAELFQSLSDAQEHIKKLYVRWAELEAMAD